MGAGRQLPVAMTGDCATTWVPTRALQNVASRSTYGNSARISACSRNAAISVSRPAHTRDTFYLDFAEVPTDACSHHAFDAAGRCAACLGLHNHR